MIDKDNPARLPVKKRRPTARAVQAAQGDAKYTLALEHILGATRESHRWLAMFASQGWLTEGLPLPQRQALFLTAAWRLALANVRRLSRDKSASSAIAIGQNLHSWIEPRSRIKFDRLDSERMAVDAMHFWRHEAFKRGKAAHG